MHGLLGPFTGQPGGSLQGSDGTEYTTDQLANYDILYTKYAASWRISQSQSLFTYQPGHNTASYTLVGFPGPRPPAIDQTVSTQAHRICTQLDLPAAALSGCAQDVAATGDAGYASSMATGTGSVPGRDGIEGSNATDQTITGDITPGGTAHGSISAGESRSYAFTVPAGTVAYFAANPGCAPAPAGSLNTYVLDGDGAHVTGETDICSDLGRLQFTKAGTYRLVVASSNGGAGRYTLLWKASRPNRARSLLAGSTASGTIDQPGALDTYAMTVTAGTVGFLAADKNCAAATSAALRWYLLDPDGGRATGELEICNSQGRIEFSRSGTYQLVVAGLNGGVGSYRVSWLRSRPDLTAALAPGASATGTIDDPGARDRYSLTVAGGTVGYFSAAPGCVDSATPALHWYLLLPGGGPLTGELEICQDQGRIQFPTSGTYQLVVASNDGGTGTFAVTWQSSRPDLTRPLPVGGLASGTIDTPGAQDRWTVTLSDHANLHVSPAANCNTSGLSWTVLDPTGTPVAGLTAICQGDVVTVPTAGSYQLVISGDGAATGSYTLTAATG